MHGCLSSSECASVRPLLSTEIHLWCRLLHAVLLHRISHLQQQDCLATMMLETSCKVCSVGVPVLWKLPLNSASSRLQNAELPICSFSKVFLKEHVKKSPMISDGLPPVQPQKPKQVTGEKASLTPQRRVCPCASSPASYEQGLGNGKVTAPRFSWEDKEQRVALGLQQPPAAPMSLWQLELQRSPVIIVTSA